MVGSKGVKRDLRGSFVGKTSEVTPRRGIRVVGMQSSHEKEVT